MKGIGIPGSSPGRSQSKPISIGPRRPAGGQNYGGNSIAQSCPAPRAPIIGSLPAPSHMDVMPPLSLPPPSPEAFSMDPIYHRNASAKFASSCPATIAHFPRSLTQRSDHRIQSLLECSNANCPDGDDSALSSSVTGFSILSNGSVEMPPAGRLAGNEPMVEGTAQSSIAHDQMPSGRIARNFSNNNSVDDGGVFELDGVDAEKEGLEKKMETLDLEEDEEGGMFDFES